MNKRARYNRYHDKEDKYRMDMNNFQCIKECRQLESPEKDR